MEEGKIVITDKAVRFALQSLGENGKEVTYPLLYEALGLPAGQEALTAKDVVRARISSMVKHGEVKRTERGSFIYDFKHRPRQQKVLESIWRFVRAAKPDWTLTECSLMTRASYSYALRYIAWLEQEGYVARSGGGKGKTVIYRNTSKARQSPETPYPPIRESDPFEKERIAAAIITRHMLCSNPYAVKTAKEITKACKVLLARFGEAENCPENLTENENEVECDVE